MTSRLKSILKNPNRVAKRKPPAPRRASSGVSNSSSGQASSSWSDSLPRTKAGTPNARAAKSTRHGAEGGEEEDFFQDRLDDLGLVRALATDLTLCDVPQAMRYSREHMFTPIPEQSSSLGMTLTRVAEVLNARRNLPPVVTTAHLQALLRSPTAVERGTAELIRAGC